MLAGISSWSHCAVWNAGVGLAVPFTSFDTSALGCPALRVDTSALGYLRLRDVRQVGVGFHLRIVGPMYFPPPLRHGSHVPPSPFTSWVLCIHVVRPVGGGFHALPCRSTRQCWVPCCRLARRALDWRPASSIGWWCSSIGSGCRRLAWGVVEWLGVSLNGLGCR